MSDHLMDIATQQLVTIARTTAYHCDEQHEYMKGAGGNDWLPHKWVIEAMRAAVTIRNTQAEDMVREELYQARAQLAEAHALLRHLYDHNELSMGDDQLILAYLSASAEPSGPKCDHCAGAGHDYYGERCTHCCASTMAKRIKSAACPKCSSRPCACEELTAPVGRDERSITVCKDCGGCGGHYPGCMSFEARAALERK